jgi:hypothetical protein
VVVAAMLLNVIFNAFNAVTTVLFDATVTDGSFIIDWIVYYNRSCSGITICWAYIQPVDGLLTIGR